jgi:hypothetical protein
VACKRCAACGRAFRPRAQVPEQRFCSAPSCQRERKRRWQQAKRASDPDYRLNQVHAQQSWSARHPQYWHQYRLRHPEYCERNRIRRRERYREERTRRVAKMDAWTGECVIPSGTYRLSPVALGSVAKLDAWTVEITLLSTTSSLSAGALQKTTG